MPVPVPATPQVRIAQSEAPVRDMPVFKGRRSFAPGATFESPAMGRKSVMPRMSTMPSAPVNKDTKVQAVTLSDYQAKVAEVNRLKLQLETTNEKLEDERLHRQKKEDEAIAHMKKLNEVEAKLQRHNREQGRHDRKAKRDEEAKLQEGQELQKAIDGLQASLDDAKGDKEAMTGKLAKLKEAFADNEQELLCTRTRLTALNHDNDELMAENEVLESKLQKATSEAADAKTEIEKLEGNISAMRDTQADERQEAEAHSKTLADRIEELTLELDEKVDQIEGLRTQHDSLMQQNDTISDERQALVKQVDDGAATAKTMQEKIDGQAAAIEKVESDLRKAQRKAQDLEAKVESLEATVTEKDGQLESKAKQVVEMKERSKKETLALKQQLTELATNLKVKEDELIDSEAKVTSLQTEVDEANEEVARLNTEVENHRAGNKETRKKEMEARKTSDDLKDDIRALKQKSNKLERMNAKHVQAIDTANAQIEQMVAQAAEQEETISDLDYKLRVADHASKKEVVVAERLRKTIAGKEKEIRCLKQSKKDIIAKANNSIDELNAEVRNLETTANDYRNNFELMRKRCLRYKQTIQSRYNPMTQPLVDDDDSASAADSLSGRRSAPVRRSIACTAVDDESDITTPARSLSSVASSKQAASEVNSDAGHVDKAEEAPVCAEDSAFSYAKEEEKVAADSDKDDDDDAPEEPAPGTPLDEMDYKTLKIKAKKLGLKQNGSKKDIIARIEAAGNES